MKFETQHLISVSFLVVNFLALFHIAKTVKPEGPSQRNGKAYIYQDSKNIAEGLNPYRRIHKSDMRKNQKYSTYLAGFF